MSQLELEYTPFQNAFATLIESWADSTLDKTKMSDESSPTYNLSREAGLIITQYIGEEVTEHTCDHICCGIIVYDDKFEGYYKHYYCDKLVALPQQLDRLLYHAGLRMNNPRKSDDTGNIFDYFTNNVLEILISDCLRDQIADKLHKHLCPISTHKMHTFILEHKHQIIKQLRDKFIIIGLLHINLHIWQRYESIRKTYIQIISE
ncbi:MAG: hypothetical protein Faunusvirus8_21 [Faunusvirus sp.]|jgi:hypothetical protein|uniref:Uncharacterized protein n=1 Tax=Faunusvirus sp. TaxID=2487766 RepID=A0A3G4ZYB4_9VIRU|nr:MAG: hypothetical protein Faunusvirus8_21 [Faunusvirus sp.]